MQIFESAVADFALMRLKLGVDQATILGRLSLPIALANQVKTDRIEIKQTDIC